MDDSVNIPALIVNDAKEAESKLILEKSGKRYLKEYELFNEWKKIKKVELFM